MAALLILLIALALAFLVLIARIAKRLGRSVVKDLDDEARILSYLASRCRATLGEIVAGTGLDEASAEAAVFRLILKGLVKYDGAYYLAQCAGR